MKNQNELSDIYSSRVLVTEAKGKAKSNKVVDQTGELEGAKKAKPTQGGTEKVEKDVKKPKDKKEFSEIKGKPSKVKESTLPNAFDRIFKSVLNEEFEVSPEVSDETSQDEENELDTEFGDSSEGEGDSSEGEGDSSEGEGDLTDQLQDLVNKLQDIISNLSSEEEGSEEEGSEEGELEGSEESPEGSEESPEGSIETTEETEKENPYEESLDLKGQLTQLSDKLGEFLTKKTSRVVKGSLGKAKGGKASEGKIPEQDGKPKAFNPSLKALQNPKGSNAVSNIKKGDNLFK